MKVVIRNAQKALPITASAIKKWVQALLEERLKVPYHEVIIHLVSKPAIAKLHQALFDDPTPTDCISLPLDDPDEQSPHRILGEIFVCPEVAIEYAKKHKKDPYQETALYIIHGLLHLLGYDDLSEKERRKMRREEKRCLKSYDCQLQ